MKEIDNSIFHLERSQNELKEFIVEVPDDIDFVEAYEENKGVIERKRMALIKLMDELQAIDPSFDHNEFTSARAKPENENESENENENESESEEEEGGGSISDYLKRQGLDTSSINHNVNSNVIDGEAIMSSMESAFEFASIGITNISGSSASGISNSGNNKDGVSNSNDKEEGGVYL